MERIQKEAQSPLIAQLKRKYSPFFIHIANPKDSRDSIYTFRYENSSAGSRLLEGVARLDNSTRVEDGERMVMVNVEKKALLRVEGVDLSELKRNEIVDLSGEGDRWEGDALDAEPFGWGVLYDKEGQREYEGFRIGDVNVCYGVKFYSDVGRVEYMGEWCQGIRWGRGAQYDRNGSVVYEGEWLHDEPLETRMAIHEEGPVVLHSHIEELIVGDNCCNGEEWLQMNLSLMPLLRVFSVGDSCFEYVKKLCIEEMGLLESVVIGAYCFRTEDLRYAMDNNYQMYVEACPSLRELRIGNASFIDYTVCTIHDLEALEVIDIGDDCFEYASFELLGGEQRNGL